MLLPGGPGGTCGADQLPPGASSCSEALEFAANDVARGIERRPRMLIARVARRPTERGVDAGSPDSVPAQR